MKLETKMFIMNVFWLLFGLVILVTQPQTEFYKTLVWIAVTLSNIWIVGAIIINQINKIKVN